MSQQVAQGQTTLIYACAHTRSSFLGVKLGGKVGIFPLAGTAKGKFRKALPRFGRLTFHFVKRSCPWESPAHAHYPSGHTSNIGHSSGEQLSLEDAHESLADYYFCRLYRLFENELIKFNGFSPTAPRPITAMLTPSTSNRTFFTSARLPAVNGWFVMVGKSADTGRTEIYLIDEKFEFETIGVKTFTPHVLYINRSNRFKIPGILIFPRMNLQGRIIEALIAITQLLMTCNRRSQDNDGKDEVVIYRDRGLISSRASSRVIINRCPCGEGTNPMSIWMRPKEPVQNLDERKSNCEQKRPNAAGATEISRPGPLGSNLAASALGNGNGRPATVVRRRHGTVSVGNLGAKSAERGLQPSPNAAQ
ncbi:unnamed protein product [Nesidiocoris tenuis]|uniref:Uncharacterized protein n=1 Tax=Nesidiocoris tenuis TaxID=355587 RepID=A0A6H5HVZ1_9HEMI|nr:unnamed protein product [Nesidiocoris tenuis]